MRRGAREERRVFSVFLAHRFRLLCLSPGTLTKSSGELDRAIAQLDPALHSLGLLHMLSARASMALDDAGDFIAACVRLFLHGDGEQFKLEPRRALRVSHKLTSIATEYGCPIRAVQALEQGVRLVQENEYQLTGVHADLLQVCLLAKCYHRGERLLRRPVLNIGEAKTNGFTQSDYLRYWYYAGMVYTGLKRFREAIDAFEQCFSAPAMVLSAPAVEAYKKWVLVSLILRGSVDAKRSGNAMMMRNLKQAAHRYGDFSTAFATKDPAALAKVAAEHAEHFTRDSNFGLVQQCIESLADRQIRALTQTYLTLNLETMAKGAGLTSKEEAQRRVVAMVEAGTIVASVNEKEGMVSFGENAEHFNDMRTMQAIDKDIRMAIQWGGLMRSLDDQIASSAEYLQKTSGLELGGGAGGGAGGPRGFGGFDEGMMGGDYGMAPGFGGLMG